ncbi:MAG TPA: glycosyltransferase, partial [Candidatus Udaeobacter sp.]|nr:glycosyltransferase [Candidatus Udaeobacter sp.]
RFVAWADRRSVQEADRLLVNGDYIGDIIRHTYRRDAIDCPAGCHVAPSGFPLPVDSRFSGGLTINGYPIRRPYVLLTNRHYPQKRFDLAIRAMAEVRKKHPRAQLVVPGPATSHTATLKSLVTELGLEEAVLFLGAISEAELQALYEGAAVYVYPAPEEDFGMGVIESMAKGVPVVAWNQAGPTVTVGPGTGHLAEPLDVSDYAAGIVSLLDDREHNQATGERAFEWARRFDWERHIDVLEHSVLDVARVHRETAAEAAVAVS